MPKKIVIIGPESTGKSTLTAALAAHFGEPWVPEYAREYLERLDRSYQFDDLLSIAKGQLELEDRMLKSANEFLFCDTDLHVLHVWSESKYKKVHPWIQAQIAARKYDLYLLTDIDIPWEPDPQREHPDPEMRTYFFNWYRALLEQNGTPYGIISGNNRERLSRSIDFIEKYL